MVEGFREQWESLRATPDCVRRLEFVDDFFPVIVFYARVESTNFYGLSIVEEVVNIFDVHVVTPPWLGQTGDL